MILKNNFQTRKIPLYLGFAFAAGVYVLLFGEFFLRIMDPQPLMPRYVTGTDYGIRGNVPNITYRHWTPEIDVEMRINSQGMRADKDFDLKTPEGVCRVALLGDSYFMGYEAALDESIAGYLEQHLTDAGYNVEILNFAVSGLGTAEMVVQFQNQVKKFSPDVTVFQWHASDLLDNIRSNLFVVDEQGRLSTKSKVYLPGVKIRDKLTQYAAYRWMIENSHIYTAARESLAKAVKHILAVIAVSGADEKEQKQKSSEDLALIDAGIPLNIALLKLAGETAEQNGSAWYVVPIPFRRSRVEFNLYLDNMDIPPFVKDKVVSPIAVFREIAEPSLKIYFERGNLHLTPIGNEIVAKLVAERMILENGDKFSKCSS